jgi:RNA polymerase sigma-70 factor (ECF subfamily)
MEPTAAPAPAPHADDPADWAALCLGDAAALERLFRRHAKAVYNFAFRRTASWDNAEEVLQTTFTTVWRRGQSGRLDRLTLDSARPYLLVVAGNECRNLVRSAVRRRALTARAMAAQAVTAAPDHADATAARLDDESAMSAVRQALARIPDNQREAIELVVWSQCSLAEAATALGVPESTVKARLHRARRSLAGLLDLGADEGGAA